MSNSFGERLSNLLTDKKLSQKELAQMAEVTEAAMSHYVNGDRIPRASVLARIASALDTTSEYLMNGTATNAQEEINYATRLIARNVEHMSKEEKMKIVSILLNNT